MLSVLLSRHLPLHVTAFPNACIPTRPDALHRPVSPGFRSILQRLGERLSNALTHLPTNLVKLDEDLRNARSPGQHHLGLFVCLGPAIAAKLERHARHG